MSTRAAWAVSLLLIAALAGPLAADNRSGFVITATNASGGNEIVLFRRSNAGRLQRLGAFATNGTGLGRPISNQNANILVSGPRKVVAVNAGSNEISSFRLRGSKLKLVSKLSSGGVMPVSVAERDGLLYVVNAGDSGTPGNISGFRLAANGELSAVSGSSRPLSASLVGPAQIAFDRSGGVLIVTERLSDKISTYVVDQASGLSTGPVINDSSGETPFGFEVDKRGALLVSEAFGGAASALSSYTVGADGVLATVSSSIDATGQEDACWVALTPNGKTAFVSNTGSGTISTYRVRRGVVTLAKPEAANEGGFPLDMAVSRDGRFLFALNAGSEAIEAYAIQSNGTLRLVELESNLPFSANGLIAR